MSHKNVLQRAWEILWQYRILWAFGFILALTTASVGPQNNFTTSGEEWRDGRYTSRSDFEIQPGEDWTEAFSRMMEEISKELAREFERDVPFTYRRTIITSVIALVSVIFIMTIVGTIFRYVSQTAVIAMVDDYEETGEKRTFREGFRLGWSRAAWRVFLIDLVVMLPLVLVMLAAAAITIVPLIIGFANSDARTVFSVITSIGLFFLMIFGGIIVAVFLKVLRHFFYRVTVLEGAGVMDAIRQGFAMVRTNLKDVGIMFLIMLGIDIGWPIVLFPFVLLFGALALLLGGGVALTVGGLSGAFAGQVGGIVATAILGGSIFILMIALPMAFVSGFKMVFQSSSWTLTFRELRALETLAPDQPALEPEV